MLNETVNFSVVVPVYNVENYLDDCIKSILEQTYLDFELILVDDGSTDNSGKICDSYDDCHIKVIHQCNQGHTKARLSGVNVARGKYIVFVDSDDTLEKNFLENIHNEISINASDMVLADIMSFTETEKHIKSHDLNLDYGFYDFDRIKNEIFPLLMLNEKGEFFPRSLCAKAIRKEFVEYSLSQVPPEIKIGEDMCCVISMFGYAKSLSVIPDTFYNYRTVSNSTSKAADINALKRCKSVLSFLLKMVEIDNSLLWPQYLRISVQQVYCACIIALRSGNLSSVKSDYSSIVKQFDFNKVLRTAYFTDRKLKIKTLLLKYRFFWLIKKIDSYGKGN